MALSSSLSLSVGMEDYGICLHDIMVLTVLLKLSFRECLFLWK